MQCACRAVVALGQVAAVLLSLPALKGSQPAFPPQSLPDPLNCSPVNTHPAHSRQPRVHHASPLLTFHPSFSMHSLNDRNRRTCLQNGGRQKVQERTAVKEGLWCLHTPNSLLLSEITSTKTFSLLRKCGDSSLSQGVQGCPAFNQKPLWTSSSDVSQHRVPWWGCQRRRGGSQTPAFLSRAASPSLAGATPPPKKSPG